MIPTAAVRAPAAAGVNVTVMLHVAAVASVAGLNGQVLVWAKSPAFAPPSAMPVMDNGAAPVLLSVTVWAALVVPVFWAANVTVDGESDTTGAGSEPPPAPIGPL